MSHVAMRAPMRQRIGRSRGELRPQAARAAMGIVLVAAAAAGLCATSTEAARHAVAISGPELTRLLRFMAVLKSGMAAAAAVAVLWRLGSPAPFRWLAAYGLGGAAIAAGPGLIWGMAHVGCGALLLHGGLFAILVLLWRDPAVAARLTALLAARHPRLSEASAAERPGPLASRSRPRG